uniref:PGG domain-containing protein n=1 Tax=Populus trichocarpa TaxID=3694 RepID=B9GMA2_POPTR
MDEEHGNFLCCGGCLYRYNYVCCSIYCSGWLMFLGILTARYAEQDFLISLPRKLIIGLSTLVISIAAMMVAFCAALLVMLDGMMEVIPFHLFCVLVFQSLSSCFHNFLYWLRSSCQHMDQASSKGK